MQIVFYYHPSNSGDQMFIYFKVNLNIKSDFLCENGESQKYFW